MAVLVLKNWNYQNTTVAGGIASGALVGPDLPMNAPGVWIVQFGSIQAGGTSNALYNFEYIIRDVPAATVRYSLFVRPFETSFGTSRMLVALDHANYVLQIAVGTQTIAAADTILVNKGAGLLGQLLTGRDIAGPTEISHEGLNVLKFQSGAP